MEKRVGRCLARTEIVHHIDFDKSNNQQDNLHLFPSRAEHRIAHMSFESVVPALLGRGILYFDRTTGRYRLCETDK